MFLSVTLMFWKLNQVDIMELQDIQELEDRMEDLEVEHDLVLDSHNVENSFGDAVHQKEMLDVS